MQYAFIRVTFIPHGIAEWPGRVDHIRRTLAIGDRGFGSSKVRTQVSKIVELSDLQVCDSGEGSDCQSLAVLG